MPTLLLSAGDASGEQHLAGFVEAFRSLHPDTRFVGMGGDRMAAAGVELAVDQRELAIGGLFELASGAGRIAKAWRGMRTALRDARPDLVVLTDSSGFNLPLARAVRRRSAAPILYYVAPQVWAWRPGRIPKLARRVDRMAVILPFEEALWRRAGVPVDYVGHPLVDAVADVRALDARAARAALALRADAGAIVALLPGSRRNEIAQHLPIQLAAASALRRDHPDTHFVLALAPSLDRAAVEASVRASGLPIALVEGRTLEVVRAADAVLAKPGTSTLEAALLERPMVVMGRANPLTAEILRRAVRVPHYAMPNLIAGEEIVPELLQGDAKPEAIARALAGLLAGPARERQLEALRDVVARLGAGGASERAARIAAAMLAGESTRAATSGAAPSS